jgi:trimeric autotransporter adhesin
MKRNRKNDWIAILAAGTLVGGVASAQTAYDTGTQDPAIAANASDIATNQSDIATNASDIATNQSDIATNQSDIATNASDIATNQSDIATNAADIATEIAERTALISDQGPNGEGNQVVHIGDNSLITEELGGTQRLRAEDGGGSAIDIQFDGDADVQIDNNLTVGAVTTTSTTTDTGNNVVGKVEVPGAPSDTEFFITRDYDRTDTIDTNGNTLVDDNGNVTLTAGTETVQGGAGILQFASKFEVYPDGHPQEGLPIPGTEEYVAVYEDPLNPGTFVEAAIPGGPFADAPSLEAAISVMSVNDFENLVSGLNNFEQTVTENGGNLQVGGDANVDGVLSLGAGDPDGIPETGDEWDAVSNVAEAIGENEQAIADEETARIAADVVLQDNIDAEATTRAAADVVLQDNIDAEVATRTSLIRRDVDGVIHVGADSFLLDDTDPSNHRISTSSGQLTLTSATGVVEVDGVLSVGSVPNVEAAIVTNTSNIATNASNISRNTQAISVNASNIAQNSARISQNSALIGENRSMIETNRAAIGRLDDKIDDVEGKAYAGIAAAASLDSIVSPSETGKTSVTGGVAFYEGEAAAGVNATHRFNVSDDQDMYLNGGVSVTSDSTFLGRVLLGAEF